MSKCTFYGEQESSHCGYCNGSKQKSRCTHGAVFDTMTTDDYQRLMFRGWRRSGTYCYKPAMREICCPQYAIRCDVARYRLSRTHRRVLRRVAEFLRTGARPGKEEDDKKKAGREKAAPTTSGQANNSNVKEAKAEGSSAPAKRPQPSETKKKQKKVVDSSAAAAVEGAGDSPAGRMREGKARQKRWARRLARLRAQAEAAAAAASADGDNDVEAALAKVMAAYRARRAARAARRAPQTLEQLLEAEENEEKKDTVGKQRQHLRIVLRRSAEDDFDNESEWEHQLYQRYQMAVHGDSAEECSLRQFRRFLCESPLVYDSRNGRQLGSFHQQYWLEPEGRLVMVGVVDVLPDCTSSVYVFYDPDYAWLNLGTYAALREIAFTRRLSLPHYCMGYYIHDCVKMRYKGAFLGSELLCPETYTWHCLRTVCAPLLDAKAYARFAPADAADAEAAAVPTDELQVSLGRRGDFVSYRQVYNRLGSQPALRAILEDLLKTFARLVGPECVRTIRVRVV